MEASRVTRTSGPATGSAPMHNVRGLHRPYQIRAAADGKATSCPVSVARVLVVDGDDDVRASIRRQTRESGCAVVAVCTGRDALDALQRELYDVVFLDLRLPDIDGMMVLAAAASLQPEARFVVMSARPSVGSAVEAVKLGATDYLAKPFTHEQLTEALDRARAENELLRSMAPAKKWPRADPRTRMVGRSAAMERLFDQIGRVAPLRTTVLITGETGTGKELVAMAIHELSGRARKAFVAVNCSALSETLLESELFGHVKGSFTGAFAGRRGLLEEAEGGTLFLDEVSTLSQQVQVKLLRVLAERAIHRVGSSLHVPIDFRLIVATNHDLAGQVAAGQFREDLYYRLNTFPILVPPLRERTSDIPLLAEHFRLWYAKENALEPPPFSRSALDSMLAHDWPGNVRELQNFVERAVILFAGAPEIRLDPAFSQRRLEHDTLRRAANEVWNLDQLEYEYIRSVLERTGGHQGRAAEILGIDRRTLYRKLRVMEQPHGPVLYTDEARSAVTRCPV